MTEILIICPTCKRPKGESHFHNRYRNGEEWHDQCKACAIEKNTRRAAIYQRRKMNAAR